MGEMTGAKDYPPPVETRTLMSRTQSTTIRRAMQENPEPVRPPGRLDIAIHARLDEAETDWRRLEAIGVLTPYQRYDWIAGLLAAGADADARIAIAIIARDGETLAILPLALRRRFGLVQAEMLGARQSNTDWIIARPDFAPAPAELRTLFEAIARAAGGIDLIRLQNQPAAWQGMANPMLGLDHAPAPSNLYMTGIGGVSEPYIEHRLTTKRRNNIKRGKRRLEEQFGPVRLVRIADPEALERVHAIFLEQRGRRFSAMGVGNIFAQPPFPGFFRSLATDSFAQQRPALVLHALMVGDEVAATCWGTMAGNHYSQYINSTTEGPAGRYSLMGILLAELMDELIRGGIESFDMGLGDFDYKAEWTEPLPVFDSLVPLSVRGAAIAALQRRQGALKRLIKQTPPLWHAAKWLRRQLSRLRPD
ncbi:MAG: hypothetical protein ABS76_17735 [Pelagibacterium sp. SCN 64-44]|nr:MAG: hypothetical protein ABS76_17735 [Pelagibacterium sp. SCN 64-44]